MTSNELRLSSLCTFIVQTTPVLPQGRARVRGVISANFNDCRQLQLSRPKLGRARNLQLLNRTPGINGG